ncbi:DUF2075 domain-containing protein [Marinihelvus fidelis]|uniref:DUF2075 domain-containing protein n=1 Tax=Marinihelvus fidelis TaxID=2613842 RepID=A0A5N0TG47_9GAMM|nr:DUF2075 domain-containing protein [Marinihelvus fidelis]
MLAAPTARCPNPSYQAWTYATLIRDFNETVQQDHIELKPSKNLADHLSSLLQSNREFQLIVEGGPGTGKSVVAINLLVELTAREKLVHYVTRNAEPNGMDVLVVDEAHRLNEKSGLYGNLGENQVKELIDAARCSVFFIDEDQRVTLKDIGTKEEIKAWAQRAGAKVTELALESQFRCNSSDGYLAWLDHALQIRPTANTTLEDIDYDFRVCDSPTELRRVFAEKNDKPLAFAC